MAAGLMPGEVFGQGVSFKKPIRMIVPFGPGGSADVIARVLQVPLQRALQQTVIIENRAGAGSNLGTTAAARSEPDGYTLLLTTSAFVSNPGMYKRIPYDAIRDFAPIADLAIAPNILTTQPKSKIGSLSDVVSLAKADPKKVNYSSPGNGTVPHLAIELFALKAGIDLTHVPYGGGGPATQALLTGSVDLSTATLPNVAEQVKAGTMKGLALTSRERWPDLPDVPTFTELGFPDVVLDTGHFLLAPAGTPAQIVDRLSKDTLAVLALPEIKERLHQIGYTPVAEGPDMLKQRIAREVSLYKELVANSHIAQIE